MSNADTISAEFPFESHFVEVLGSRMHYIDEGQGPPILFLHGNPTSSYLWRNVIPHLLPLGRCIAPDLIGMGRSDKPNLDYTFFDHARYLDGFIEALDLRDVTLVVHDWGSGLGFHYAARNPDNVRALAFMEAMVSTFNWADFPADFRMGFRMFRAPVIGGVMIQGLNVFLDKLMPQTIRRPLTDVEQERYHEPYPTWGSRKPVRVWPQQIPIDGKPADVHEVIASYAEWLRSTDKPKLLLYAHPGGILDARAVERCKETLPALETVDVGEGVHYLQEDNPHGIGEAIADWMTRLPADS